MPSIWMSILIVSSIVIATLFPPHIYSWSSPFFISILWWLLFFWFYDGLKKRTLSIKRGFPLPLVAFLAIAVFYTFYSIDVAVSRDFLFFLIAYATAFFLVFQLSADKDPRWITTAIFILGIITSVYGLYQHFWGFHNLLGKIAEIYLAYPSPFQEDIVERLKGGRIFSTFLLPSHFAAFLGLTIPISVGFTLSQRGLLRYLVGLGVVPQIIALYLTKSFSGWLSLMLGGGTFAIVYWGYMKEKSRYLFFTIGGLAATILIVFAALTINRPDNLFSTDNNPLYLRAMNWLTTIDIIKDNPLVGKGLHTYGLIYPAYQKPGVNIVHHAHNTYLQLGVEMSIIGTILFIWFALWWFWRTITTVQATKDKTRRFISCSLMVAGINFFIHHAFDFEFYHPNTTLAGFAVLAAASKKRQSVYRLRIKKRRKIPLAILAITVVVVISILIILPFYARIHHECGRSFMRPTSYNDKMAAAELEKAILYDPIGSEYRHTYGIFLAQRGRLTEGIVQLKEAIRLSHWRHTYHFDLGMIYLQAGDWQKGLEAIKKASSLFPLNAEYHQALKWIYLQMGDKMSASQEEEWIERIRLGR